MGAQPSRAGTVADSITESDAAAPYRQLQRFGVRFGLSRNEGAL